MVQTNLIEGLGSCLRFLVVSFVPCLVFAVVVHARTDKSICRNPELMKALTLIDSACHTTGCDLDKLRGLDGYVDRDALLGALRNSDLYPTHVFFPTGLYETKDILDWDIKKEQLSSLRFAEDPDNWVFYVIGKASVTGSAKGNESLSYSRTESVQEFLQDDVGIRSEIRIGYLGEEALQFTASDARLLNIDPLDYRDSVLVLNQSVFVFAYPCKRLLRSH